MKDIFLVVWSGGVAVPRYKLLPENATDVDAWALAQRWAEDAGEANDFIDVLRIDLTTRTIDLLGTLP